MTKGISVGHILTRDAMKNLKGGVVHDVNCTAMPGYHVEQQGSCSGSVSACQAAANAWCTAANHCASCTVV